MKPDGDRALLMLADANPIPDPAAYLRLSRHAVDEAASPTTERTTVITIDRPQRRPVSRKPSVVGALILLLAGLGAVGVGTLLPAGTGAGQPPFAGPVAAIRAFQARDHLPWSEMSDLFEPGAIVDSDGVTRAWDSPALAGEWDMSVALGSRATVGECHDDGGWGVCRVTVTDDLLEEAGIRLQREVGATLGETGRIAILRLRPHTSDDEEALRRWYVAFNQWICRTRPADGRRLWDPEGQDPRFDPPDCQAGDWTWTPSGSPATDADLLRSLHARYIADDG